MRVDIRLAMRVEGDWWVAYMARANTMDDAKKLGSIHMGIVRNSDERKMAFMELMRDAVADAVNAVCGEQPLTWSEPEPAPESECAGNA